MVLYTLTEKDCKTDMNIILTDYFSVEFRHFSPIGSFAAPVGKL